MLVVRSYLADSNENDQLSVEAEGVGQGNKNDWRAEHLAMKGEEGTVRDVTYQVEVEGAEGGADMQAALDDIPWEVAAGLAVLATDSSEVNGTPYLDSVAPLEAMDAQIGAVLWDDMAL